MNPEIPRFSDSFPYLDYAGNTLTPQALYQRYDILRGKSVFNDLKKKHEELVKSYNQILIRKIDNRF